MIACFIGEKMYIEKKAKDAISLDGNKKKKNNGRDALSNRKKRKRTPTKVLCYFPFKPCLQRLLVSSKTVKHMKGHVMESNIDNLIRHLKDFKAWKRFDSFDPEFSSNP